jgi:hypothetical protein
MRLNTGWTPSEAERFSVDAKAKTLPLQRQTKTMSKAEYTLLAAVIGFYALLFAYLFTRACTAVFRACWPTASVKVRKDTRRVARNRAWTHAVWRAPLAPEMERGSKPAASMTA